MKQSVLLVVSGALLMANVCAPAAEIKSGEYPHRPIRMLVPQAPGGTADRVARVIAPDMSRVLGQQLVIDNRAGAGGVIGTELAAKATPDGYTISLNGAGPLTILPHVSKPAPYDPVRDFQALSLITISPFALVAHPSVQAKTVKELIAFARAQPGQLNYASAGSGSVIYLGMELLKGMGKVDIQHVPYKGSAQGLVDVLAGRVSVMLFSVLPVIPHVKADRLRLLALTSANRSARLPDVPTIAEAGFAGYDVTTWTGIFLPLNTPRVVGTRLQQALQEVLGAPQTRSQLSGQGFEIVGSTPEKFQAFVRNELANNGRIINGTQ